MAKYTNICFVIFTLIAFSEQRPTILQNEETNLLEGSRAARSIKDETTTPSSDEETPKHLLKGSRVIRSTDSEDTTLVSTTTSSETTSQSTKSAESVPSVFSIPEETQGTTKPATTEEPREALDFYDIFLKAVLRSPDEIIAKRSLESTYGDEEQNIEDLDTAANTVFRPLFVYRQQNAQRRRLRQLNVF